MISSIPITGLFIILTDDPHYLTGGLTIGAIETMLVFGRIVMDVLS